MNQKPEPPEDPAGPQSAGPEREAGQPAPGTLIAGLEAAARDFTLCLAMTALRRLDDLSRSEDEKIAFTAIQEILNRALGKNALAATPATPRQPVIRIVNYADWLERQMERKDG